MLDLCSSVMDSIGHIQGAGATRPHPTGPPDYNGRIYSQFDIALLRAIGVGSRPARLQALEEVLERTR